MSTVHKLSRARFQVEIQAAFDEVVARVAQVNALWPQWVESAVVYRLPVWEDEVIPAVIEPEVVEGAQAVAAAQAVLGQFHWLTEQHVKTVVRLPGVVVLRQALKVEFEAVNAAKARFRQLFQNQYSKPYRPVAARRLFPGCSLLQVYRQVQALDVCPQRILFSWAGHTTLAKRLTRAQVIEWLSARRDQCPPDRDPAHWALMVAQQLKKVDRIPPGAQYRLQRVLAPHPRVMVYLNRPSRALSTPHEAMWHANVPLFVYRPPKAPAPRIDGLKVFDRARRSRPRRDRLRREPLVEGLDLWVVYPHSRAT